MSMIATEVFPTGDGRSLTYTDFMEQAGGDLMAANRLLFLADIEINLLADPGNQNLQELHQMAQDDLSYFMVAKSLGRVAC